MNYTELITSVFIIACLSGCMTEEEVAKSNAEYAENRMIYDQCVRREIFNECMEVNKAHAFEKSRSELISSCGAQADKMSTRKAKAVKDHCKSE